MNKNAARMTLVLVALVASALVLWILSDSSAPSVAADAPSPTSVLQGEKDDTPSHDRPESPRHADMPTAPTEAPETHFSPEVKQLVHGIQAGKPVAMRVGDAENHYIFRDFDVTTEDFTISTGPHTPVPSSYQVFEGRQLLLDGSLGAKAKLAVVNDKIAMAYETEKGQFLITSNEQGELVQRTLVSFEEGSTHGHFECRRSRDMHGSADASADAPTPPDTPASITLAAGAGDPSGTGLPSDNPYYRLGAKYDASLKDIRILMVSGKTQTGTSTNLSTRAAEYFTIAATLADIYERQLGFRYQLQEIVLIAGDSTQPDIEVSGANTINTGGDDIDAVRSWCANYRPKATYQWDHVQAWTLVDGSSGGVVGWAYEQSFGTQMTSYSTNERTYGWQCAGHELGHSMGTGHTAGGIMNASLSTSNKTEDFFAIGGGQTGAKNIYDFMKSSSSMVGPAHLRHPNEIPFGNDDSIATAANTPVTIFPLTNDLVSSPNSSQVNVLRLVEVGLVHPISAGTASMSGNSITFTPASGYVGQAWFTYTLGGSVGNGGLGWLHSADVVVTIGGGSAPNLNPSLSATDDVVWTNFSNPIRINPLLNDQGKGRLWPTDIQAISDFTSSPGDTGSTWWDRSFRLVNATKLSGAGTVTLETAPVVQNGLSTAANTGYLVYTPAAGDTSPGGTEPTRASIQYTVQDANGAQATGTIFLNYNNDTVSVSADRTHLIEREGRVVTITLTRTGDTADPQWVDCLVNGQVSLSGSTSDVALSGFQSFNPTTRIGRAIIPAGQSSVSLKLSAMEDGIAEGEENLQFHISAAESLGIHPTAHQVLIPIKEVGEIATALFTETFDTFPLGLSTANGWLRRDWPSASTDPAEGWYALSGDDPAFSTSLNGSTGPRMDHTSGSGIYMIVSNNRYPGKTLYLVSPSIDLSNQTAASFEFYYHMFGENITSLNVDVYSGGTWHNNVMPVLTGQQQAQQSDPYRKALIDVSAYTTSDFRVRFRAPTSASNLWRGNTSIDDVRIGIPALPPTESPVIAGQPQSQSPNPGDSAYLSVVAQASPSPTYQWKKNGVAISGATRSVLHFPSVTYSDSGNYTCEVTSISTVTTSTAKLSVGGEDSDNDSLPDSWEMQYFGTLDDGPSNDFDGDGIDNLAELMNGTNPNHVPPAITIEADPSTSVALTLGIAPTATAGANIELNASSHDGTGTWTDGKSLWNLTLDAGVTHLPNPGSSYPGITAAYDFPGGTGNLGGATGASFHALSGWDANPVSLEIWFKPDSAADDERSNGQILFETGGTTGLGIFYNDGTIEVGHDSTEVISSHDVSGLIHEYIQVVLTYNETNFTLYVNGVAAASGTKTGADWSGSDGAALGCRGGTTVGGRGTTDTGTESFEGAIAMFRAYRNKVLTAAEVLTNHRSIAGAGSTTVALSPTITSQAPIVSTSWSVISQPAPGTVTVNTPDTPATSATFTMAGTYVLRLTANDGTESASQTITITVLHPANYNSWTSGPFSHAFTDTASNSNPDGDRRSNLMEFAFGTDPTKTDIGPLALDGTRHGDPVAANPDGSGFALYFIRRIDHGSSNNAIYTTWFSNDLTNFESTSTGLQVVAVSAVDGRYELVKVPFPATLTNGKPARFGYVQIEANP